MIEIDLIILSYAKNDSLQEVTETGINSLFASEDSGKIKFNVFVIESNKSLAPFQYDKTKTIYPESSFGFNKYLNIGLSHCTSQFICFCNNDLIYEKNWASIILEAMNGDPELLSASSICPSFHPQHGFMPYTGVIYGQQAARHVSGWCIFINRRVLDMIGKLDEKILFWYAENDYSELLKRNHIKHALVTDSVVHHLVETTLLSLDYVDRYETSQGSFIYFDYKWNHKNKILYLYRKFLFNLRVKVMRFKAFVKHILIRNK